VKPCHRRSEQHNSRRRIAGLLYELSGGVLTNVMKRRASSHGRKPQELSIEHRLYIKRRPHRPRWISLCIIPDHKAASFSYSSIILYTQHPFTPTILKMASRPNSPLIVVGSGPMTGRAAAALFAHTTRSRSSRATRPGSTKTRPSSRAQQMSPSTSGRTPSTSPMRAPTPQPSRTSSQSSAPLRRSTSTRRGYEPRRSWTRPPTMCNTS
jgi:hypothetical protein